MAPRLPEGVPKERLPFDTFTSAPAAAISGDGKVVYLVCRARDLTYWYSSSWDGGRTWFGYWSPLDDKNYY